MSNLKNYLHDGLVHEPPDWQLNEIRDIVLEETGFKWIPVSKGPPPINGDYLLVDSEGHQFIGTFEDNEWTIIGYKATGFIAYMSLPKPYHL